MIKTIAINVTQDHIDNGNPGEGDSCAIAQALLELVPDIDDLEVNTPTLHFTTKDGTEYRATTPDVVSEFISEYDEDGGEDEDGDSYWPGKENCRPQVFTVDFEVTEHVDHTSPFVD